MVSEKQILEAKKAGDIFSSDVDRIKAQYKDLVKQFHPDVNKSPKANEIFQKLNELYSKALKDISSNTWEKSNFIKINKTTGKSLEITFLTELPFELGTCYICNKHIVYLFDKDKKKYKDNMLLILKQIKYKNTDMENEFKRYLPKVLDEFETTEGKHGVVLEKTIDVYPLKKVFEFYNNKIEDRHVAWILSRLNNITCFLKYNNIVHNGINIDNCFISPEHHAIILYGGWWYATKKEEKMIGTTKEIYDLMPVTAKNNKISNSTTDLESIKYIGRKLLGDTNCRTLPKTTTAPAPMVEFLIQGSTGDAYKMFGEWDVALNKGYGARKFIPMNVTKKQIYNL